MIDDADLFNPESTVPFVRVSQIEQSLLLSEIKRHVKSSLTHEERMAYDNLRERLNSTVSLNEPAFLKLDKEALVVISVLQDHSVPVGLHGFLERYYNAIAT